MPTPPAESINVVAFIFQIGISSYETLVYLMLLGGVILLTLIKFIRWFSK